MKKENDFRYNELCVCSERLKNRNTPKLYKSCIDLRDSWDKNNMLYNSIKFYQIYNRHVERSELVKDDMICKKRDWMGEEKWSRDVMTSWWTPTKYFLFKSNKGAREALSEKLLKEISREKNDASKLIRELSSIRYGEDRDKVISKDVFDAFMSFLEVIYCKGNFTCGAMTVSGGSLDNWDEKLENIKKKYLDSNRWDHERWKKYVEGNAFQAYFKDGEYTEIEPFWNHGKSELGEAKDKEWRDYFRNVKSRIEIRNNQLSGIQEM